MTLTAENYYTSEASKAYMSVSQLKAFDNCEAAAIAEINGEYRNTKTTALLVGGYVDAFFAGETEQFKEENPDLFVSCRRRASADNDRHYRRRRFQDKG